MTTHTDRIRQMAQEAWLHINGHTTEERAAACARFAQLVAKDCAREMRAEIAKMAPTISEAATQGDSVTHVVEMCAAAAAFYVSARYSLKD